MTGEKSVIGMVAACPFPSSQGSQVLIRQFSRALSRRGHTVHVITYPLGDLPPDPNYTLHRVSTLIPYKKLDPGPSLIKPLLDLSLLIKVISVVRREKIVFLYGHNYEGILVAWVAARWLGIPAIYHCHSLLGDELPTYFSGNRRRRAARRLGSLIDRFTAIIPDHIIAVSPEIVRNLSERGVDPGEITVIPPGIIPEEWENMSPPLDHPAKEPKIVYTGNLAAFQNIPQLLEAFRLVEKEVPGVTLEVITPSSTEELTGLAGVLGIEENLSVVVEREFGKIAALLHQADLACSMRTMESGFPIKNLNYMAAGLPVVCYESGAKGVIHGETGLVVKDNDVVAFSMAVVNLLKNNKLRRAMGGKAREIAFLDYNGYDLAAKAEKIQEGVRS